MYDSILASFDIKAGLRLGSQSAYEQLAVRLANFPLNWQEVHSIAVVGANLHESSYELEAKFGKPDGKIANYTLKINDFEMRIE